VRVVSYNQFLDLPPGTIFSAYKPKITTGLYRKEDTWLTDPPPTDDWCRGDFLYRTILADSPVSSEDMMLVLMDDSLGRWGQFDPDALFAVYEPSDLDMLRAMLDPSYNPPA
jgi:hypothetical protein